MKSFTVLVITILLTIVHARDVLDDLSDECAKSTGTPLDFIHQAEKGLVNEDKNCYSLCLFKKAGFVNEEGVIQLETVKKMVPEVEKDEDKPKSLAAIEKCKEQTGKDLCDKVFQIHSCYMKSFPHSHDKET